MDDISKRLKAARKDAGFKTATAASESLGVKYVTYSAHENGTRGIPSDTLVLYSRRYGVTVDWLLNGTNDRAESQPIAPPTRSIVGVPVRGKVSASLPVEVGEMEGDWLMHEYETVPGVSGYPAEWQYAFEIDGDCLNKIAPHGSTVVCLDLIASGVEVRDGDLVIIERSAFGGQAFFRTAKRIRRTSSGYDLWPESTHPDHQEPIPINAVLSDDDIVVRAKVLWIMQRP